MHPSAYGPPLIGKDAEFLNFLAKRKDANHMTGVALRLRQMRERARRFGA